MIFSPPIYLADANVIARIDSVMKYRYVWRLYFQNMSSLTQESRLYIGYVSEQILLIVIDFNLNWETKRDTG